MITGFAYALIGVRAKRVHTFFGTAFLAALGTTLLILYLMTPPTTRAVQGAFVVAAVCTGAALGGLAVLFNDVAECLGCLLGGFSLSMWLQTLHPGGLVPDATTKVVFIAVFTLVGFCLYFSRWTRRYGLIACISFSGATAVVLGIDCFSRAGLKEFWAYIWDLNDGLFPDGTDTYPLNRGLRVELAVTVIISVIGVISQLKLWRLIQNHRNKSTDESSDEEVVLPDEEESIGRRVEEQTNLERREWERMYGDGGSDHETPPDSAVGGVGSEKREGHSKRTSSTSATEVQSPIEPLDGKRSDERAETTEKTSNLTLIEKDAGDGGVLVRVIEDDMPDEAKDSALQEEDGGLHENSPPPTTRRSSQSGPEPPIVPLPFRIPSSKAENGRASVAASADEEEGSSVAAVADENEHESTAPAQGTDAQDPAVAPQNLTRIPWRLSQSSTGSRLKRDRPDRGYASSSLSNGVEKDGSDSVIATLDDASSNGDADTAILGWSPRSPEGSVEGSSAGHQDEPAVLLESKTSPDTPADADKGAEVPAPGDPRQPTAESPSSSTGEPKDEARDVTEDNQQDGATAAPLDSAAASLSSPESVPSLRTMFARLTQLNLPPALPDVALTYRTNEWAKHLSIADAPEPEALQTPELISEALDEKPAHLDIAELQQTAENGAPLPAATRKSSAISIYTPPYALSRSTSRASQSGVETAGFAPAPELHPGHRPVAYHSASMFTQRRASALLAEPIAEEDSETRSNAEAPPVRVARHGRSASMPSADFMSTHPKPHTLISMRETLLRSRTSGIITPVNQTAAYIPTDPAAAARRPLSDAGSFHNYASSQPRSSTETDLDDLPLSRRRAMIRQSSLPLAARNDHAAVTAESAAFNSHQPRSRNSSVPTEAIRQAQLANFRNSVAADLRAAAPVPTTPSQPRHRRNQRSTSSTTTTTNTATTAVLGLENTTTHHTSSPGGGGGGGGSSSKGEVIRTMELQRSILLGQKEAEAQRRGAEAAERERRQREFQDRMRSGALMSAHRDAMRRLQGGVITS